MHTTCFDVIIVDGSVITAFDNSIKEGPQKVKNFFEEMEKSDIITQLMPGWDEDFFKQNRKSILSGEYTFKKAPVKLDNYTLYLLGTPEQLKNNESIAGFQYKLK